MTLILVDAAFDLVAGGQRTAVDALWWNETMRDAAGEPVWVRHHGPYAALEVGGPRLEVDGPFRVSFPAGAEGRLDGTVSAADAIGPLTVGGQRHDLGHDSVLLGGSLAMRLDGRAPDAAGNGQGLDVGVQGKATRAVVAGVSVARWAPTEATRAGVGVLAVAAALALAGRLFVAPLYHRLGPADLLANANRRRIHDAIRQRPGIDVGAIVDAVGLSRVLVRHHLRMLEAHKLVRATVWRRRRTYALAGTGPGVAACELKDATRRRVAAAVAGRAGVTQADLVRALGLSQRLVSYHLARLAGAALVRAEGGKPRLYVATPALAHALEREGACAGAGPDEPMGHALGKGGEGAASASPA